MKNNKIVSAATRLIRMIGARTRRTGAAVVATALDHRPDALLIAGAGCVAYGVWLIHQPSGFIAAGALLLIGGYATRGVD